MESRPRWNPTDEVGLPTLLRSFVNGGWTSAVDDVILDVEDPGDGIVVSRVDEAAKDVISSAVESAHAAFRNTWGRLSPRARSAALFEIARVLRSHADELAHLETVDTGKPLSQSRGDVELSAQYFEYYAGIADKVHGNTIPQSGAVLAYTTREPFGVIAHITPWNSPLNQMSRGVAPSLAVGNTVVVKPSELTPMSTLYAAALFIDAGLPRGAFNVVVGRGPTVGSSLVRHPLVAHVTFTGSVSSGQSVMRDAAENVVAVNLELGGKSPMIVRGDADLMRAAEAGAQAVIRNAGQTCWAATRLLVHQSVHDEFLEKLAVRISRLSVGHGLDDLDIGPLASQTQVARVSGFVDGAVADGAVVAGRGSVPDRTNGYYFAPVVLDQVRPDMTVARDEVFGPVQSILTFESDDEAIAIANDSSFGLSAAVFTRDLSAAHRLAASIDAGQVQVNGYPLGGVDTPFGGYKKSGIGREKGVEAIDYYSQLKTVMIRFD